MGRVVRPSKDSCTCSRHFVDRKPTLVNPNPTLNIGSNTTSRALLCSPPTGNRKCTGEIGWINLIRTKTSKLDKTQKKEATEDNIPDSETFDDELEMNETVDFDLPDLEKSLKTDIIDNINNRNKKNEHATTLNALSFHITFILFLIILSILLLIIKLLYEKVLTLKGKIKEMENEKKQHYWKKILSSRSCSFFTNIDNTELFHALHDKVAPLVRRRYEYKDECQSIRSFQETPKRMGRERKLDSKDEFLLTFMTVTLGHLNQDLAQ